MQWGSFGSGLTQGLQQGQQYRAGQMALQDQARQRAAMEAASNWLQQGMPGMDAPGPTAVPPQPIPAVPNAPPVQGAGPTPVPMPGATPMPGAGPAAPPASLSAPPMLRAPQAGPQPSPQMGPQPGPQGPAVSGTAQPTGDIWADSRKTIQSITRSIAQANPGRKWKPGEMLEAVNTAIKTMEGLNPMERIAAQAQIAGANAQYKYWDAALKDQRSAAGQDIRRTASEQAHEDRQAALKAAMERVKLTTDTRLKAQQMADATRLQAAELVQSSANDRSDKLLDFRRQALDAGLDEKVWAQQLQAGLKEEGMSDAFISRVFSAQSAAGQSPAAPQRAPRQALPTPPSRGGRTAPAAGKPIPASTMAQWSQVPPANKAAAKQHLADQGYDVSGLR